MFSVNHKFQATLLQNRGRLEFEDRFAEWGLSQVPEFPGLDSLSAPQEMASAGAHIWLTDQPGEPGRIHLAAVGKKVRGVVEVEASASASTSGAAEAEISEARGGGTRFSLEIDPGGAVEIKAKALGELPVRFDFSASDLEPDEIEVESPGASPVTTEFEIQLHDRHGFAFADLNGDGISDVFVVSGGAGGRIEDPRINALVDDQLMISDRGTSEPRFVDRIRGSGIEKGRCRGREAMWADFDRDRYLDLLITCENRSPTFFRGSHGNGFSVTAGPPIEAGTFRWAVLGHDRPVLLAGAEGGLEVWSYSSGGWVRLQRLPSGRDATQIVPADIDNDGQIDVLALAGREVLIYRNRAGRLTEWNRIGSMLPSGEVALSAVDVDNDGWLDLSFARHGLMRWDSRRSMFVRTGQLTRPGAGYAILNWPDLDGDGRRDLLAAYSRREFSPRSRVRVSGNRVTAGRWLQVDLRGDRGNAEGIGARVVVEPKWTRPGRAPHSITQFVGQNEGSRHSQGHYRTYFGVAGATRADVTVHWPAGGRTAVRDVRTSRILVIRR